MSKTKHPVIRNLCVDAALLGVALVVFALFHHVLPRQQQSVGIVIPNPYKTEAPAGDESGLTLPEGTVVTASAGMSDGGFSWVVYSALASPLFTLPSLSSSTSASRMSQSLASSAALASS